jgi:CheY-like chemotaxis protein
MTGGTERKRRVLVIDDSEVARHAIRDLLVRADFDVVALPSAIGATRLILQQRIEAAVVDLSMPGLSGDRLVEVLRKNPRLGGLVVVLVSGESEAELKSIRRKVDVQGVMTKDMIARELVPLLEHLLPRQRSTG